MKSSIIFLSLLTISVKFAYGGFFDEIVSDVKSAGETIGQGAASAYNWTAQEVIPKVSQGAASAYNWTTHKVVPKVEQTFVSASEAVKSEAVVAHNWTTEILTEITANETLLTSLMAEAKSNNIWTKIIIGYYILINVICFLYMGHDKIRAMNGEWRVSEMKLLLFSLIDGALGGFIAMILCWHKIRNVCFMIYFPGLAVLHLYLLYHFNIF